jgi:hypothetical protein
MAASSRTCSGPNAPFECVHKDRLIAPTKREASPRLSPAAAAVMIHTAQDGKLSITDVPPLHRLSGLAGEPAGAIPSRSTRRRDDDQERHDWAQWDERTNDRPTTPVGALLIAGPRLGLDGRRTNVSFAANNTSCRRFFE